MRKIASAYAVVLVAITCAPALGQEMKGHDHSRMTAGSDHDSASTRAYKAANTKMHEGMGITYSGDADVDFVRGMIAHHQGAIDMAKVELEHGRDPLLRKLAEEVVEAQQREIGQMQAWLKANGR